MSAVVFGGYCATYGVLVLFDVVELGGPRATGDRIAIALIFFALAAASVALWWFLGRVALRVDDREVVVENPLRTYVIPRADVVGMRTTRMGFPEHI